MYKWFKQNKKKIIVIAIGVLSSIALYKVINIESTPSVGEFIDIPENYDDKEFYELTHNADGTLNDYGMSLDN